MIDLLYQTRIRYIEEANEQQIPHGPSGGLEFNYCMGVTMLLG